MTITDTYEAERQALSDQDLDQIHRAELRACLEENEDSEFTPWSPYHPVSALRDAHKDEWAARIRRRDAQMTAERRAEEREAKAAAAEQAKEEKAAERVEKTVAAKPEPAALTCLDCGTEIPRTGKRGRPPKRCEPCRVKFEEQENAPKPCGACANGGKGRHSTNCKKGKK